MSQHQEIEQICINRNPGFKYGDLDIIMGHCYRGLSTFDQVLVPYAEVYWKETLIEKGNHAAEALQASFNSVRVCRPGEVVYAGQERADILMTMSALGPLLGLDINGSFDVPETITRLHPEDDRLRAAFRDWEDRPSVNVYASLSSVDRHNFHNEAIMYRIHMETFANTFTHQVNMPSWDLIDIKELLVSLMIKHFA